MKIGQKKVIKQLNKVGMKKTKNKQVLVKEEKLVTNCVPKEEVVID